MKELEVKELELRKDLKNIEELIIAKNEEITKLIEQEANYFDKELEFNRLLDKKRELKKKIEILNDAMDVLNGIGM